MDNEEFRERLNKIRNARHDYLHNVAKKLKEIGFVKEVKGKGKYTFISDFIYVKMKVAKLN